MFARVSGALSPSSHHSRSAHPAVELGVPGRCERGVRRRGRVDGRRCTRGGGAVCARLCIYERSAKGERERGPDAKRRREGLRPLDSWRLAFAHEERRARAHAAVASRTATRFACETSGALTRASPGHETTAVHLYRACSRNQPTDRPGQCLPFKASSDRAFALPLFLFFLFFLLYVLLSSLRLSSGQCVGCLFFSSYATLRTVVLGCDSG